MFDEIGYVPTMVCIAHMSFVPCRHAPSHGSDPCQTTSEGAKVELVRKYQSEGEK